MDTTSRGAVFKHKHAPVSPATGLYIIIYYHVDCTAARPALTSLEQLLHCAHVWINVAGTKSLCVYNEFANFTYKLYILEYYMCVFSLCVDIDLLIYF